MTLENIDHKISDHKHLNLLLNGNEITGFSDFSDLGFVDQDFKNHIETQYIDSFNVIYKKYEIDSKNSAKTSAFLRSLEFLSTPKIINIVATQYYPKLDAALNILKRTKNIVDEKPENFNVPLVNNTLNVLILNICNRLDQSEVIENGKKQLIAHCLYICDAISHVNPKHHKEIYVARKDVLKYIEKIDSYKTEESHLYFAPKIETDEDASAEEPILEKKVKKRGAGFYISIAIAVAYVAYRFFSRIN